MTDKPRVFISYRRSDGEAFATQLRKRLEREEPEITLWQDRARMEGGVGWWKQITDALDAVQFMVLVMTPDAMESEVVRKEWRYARQQGVCIYPVKGAPDLHFDHLPRWMRDAHFYDLDREWETFVHHLKSPCQVTRVPFMAPDLPEGFVERPAEFRQLVGYLLDKERQNPVAITTALHGAGGFGKTTLAAALCHDDDVITAFDDGILWVTLGQTPDMVAALTTLYAALMGERPGFATDEDAATALTERLSDKDCLIVIDDVWNAAYLRPFLRGGERCARLITTRQFDIAAEARRVDVDEMATDEAVQLLTARLEAPPDDLEPFWALARRLGEWPLMLELAGAALRQRLARGDTLEGALAYLNKALDKRGVVAFDQRKAEERNQAIAKSIAVSMDLLTEDERERYLQLAIFPEDTDVPLRAVGALWDLDDFDTEEQAQRLDDLSLLKFDLQAGTIRLHDVMRAYLADQLADPVGLHAALLEAWGDPHHLPNDYAWHWVTYHLKEAGRVEELRALLFDFDWLQAKLDATDVNALIVDYDFTPDDADLRLVQGAIRLAAHILAQDRIQLAEQLLGRLLAEESPEIQELLEQAKRWRDAPWLRPVTPSLPQPGGSLLRTLPGHTRTVYAVAVTPDGKRAISASADATLKIWDLSSDKELFTLQGHTHYVYAVAVTPNGQLIISGSEDATLKIWDLEIGTELHSLSGHDGPVRAIAVTSDGKRVVSCSVDATLKVWDLEIGTEILTVVGAGGYAVTVTPDGAKVIASFISSRRVGILKVWDLESGAELLTITGHDYAVTALAVTPDGQRLISASGDAITVWDLENGNELYSIHHPSHIDALAVMLDGQRIISASGYSTLKVWDLESGAELFSLPRSTNLVRSVAIIPPDGTHIITGANDGTLKMWDLGKVTKPHSLHGHTFRVMAVAVTLDSRRAVSASYDGTLKVWDLETGAELHTLGGHNEHVYAVAAAPDGKHAVSASADATLKVWDIENGDESLTITGHTRHVHAVAVTSDGKHIVSASHDGTLKVWDIDSGAELFSLICESGTFDRVMAIPDGRCLVSASNDGTLKILDTDHEVKLLNLQSSHTNNINAMAVSSDGKRAISHSYDGTKVWDLDNGAELLTLQSSTHEDIRDVALTPGGLHAVLAWENGSLEVWDLSSEAKLYTLINHTGPVTSVAVTPDSHYAVSASFDYTLKVWDLYSGEIIASFYGESSIRVCTIAPDGVTIVAGEESGRVHILRLEGVG